MSFIYNMADTWNAVGTTFNSILMNVTNGASGAPVGAAASKILNLQSNGSTVFGVDVNGITSIGTSVISVNNASTQNARLLITGTGANTGMQLFRTSNPGAGGGLFGFSATRGATPDSYTIVQTNDGLGTFIFGGADGSQYVTAAQYRVFVDASPAANDVRGAHSWYVNQGGGANVVTEAARLASSGIFTVVGTDAAPTSGASLNGSLAIGPLTSAWNTNFGTASTLGYGWVQVRSNSTGGVYNTFKINPNGGSVSLGSLLATNATEGFVYISTCAGTPTGTPTAISGVVPLVFDTTNNQLWIYDDGAWKQPKTPAAAATVTWQ